ncbi:MAG: VCBS repeat-containing protein [Myxococcota bacterium]
MFDVSAWHPAPNYATVGLSRSAIHDVDRDGAADLLIGSVGYFPNGELVDLPGSGCEPGGMVLWTGATTPGTYTRGTETAVIEGTCMSCIGGLHLPVGRIGPDRERNLVAVVGESATFLGVAERGAIFLVDLEGVHGTVDVTSISPAIIAGAQPYMHLTDVLPLGDLNRDGVDDLLVSSRFASGRGAVFVFLGPIEGIRSTATADLTIVGSDDNQIFGAALAGSDFDGDGLTDILVGDDKCSHSAPDAGAVHYFRGRDLLEIVDPAAFALLPPLETEDTAGEMDSTGETGSIGRTHEDSGDKSGTRCGCSAEHRRAPSPLLVPRRIR